MFRSKQAVPLQGPCCSFWYMSHTPPMFLKPILCYAPGYTHLCVFVCVCVCVCVCCGRVILPCLTQSTSVTCCNPEHHLQDNVKSTASSSPPCTPSMCINLHTAPPLHDYACEARHSSHDSKSAAFPKQCSFAFIASHQRPSAMLS